MGISVIKTPQRTWFVLPPPLERYPAEFIDLINYSVKLVRKKHTTSKKTYKRLLEMLFKGKQVIFLNKECAEGRFLSFQKSLKSFISMIFISFANCQATQTECLLNPAFKLCDCAQFLWLGALLRRSAQLSTHLTCLHLPRRNKRLRTALGGL